MKTSTENKALAARLEVFTVMKIHVFRVKTEAT
jgi:hypothetical protein